MEGGRRGGGGVADRGSEVRERRQQGGRHAGVDGGREGSYTPQELMSAAKWRS